MTTDDRPRPAAGRAPERLVPPATKPHTSVFRVLDAWYILEASEELGTTPRARTLLGMPLVLFRTRSGRPAAMLDRCAHRNVPLSLGKVVGEHVQCPYHGWEFDHEGRCRNIPGLVDTSRDQPDSADARARRVMALPVAESDGWVWVWGNPDSMPTAPPFAFPRLDPRRYTSARREVQAPGTLHATLENALDVPHTAFLHGGLFRTQKVRNRIRATVRRYAAHATVEYVGEPRPSGLVGRVLSPSGGVVEHWDRFFLPSVAQVEYRIGDENHFIVTSACTPVSDFETRLFALVQFRTRFPGPLVKLVLDPIARRIFGQDQSMLGHQTELIQRFGGEQFESTELDLIGPHIYRLLKDAADGRVGETHDTPAPGLGPIYEKTIELMA
ncbi:MAG: aromatic ring-hydroxylating dioxygenase subunit alpha [Myxococcota bacterium]